MVADAQHSWAGEPCVLGVDEAGRGPVLGPMVYGVAYCPMRLKEALAKRAFADSKTLTEEKREALFGEIEADEEMGFAVDSASASAISSQMLRSDKVSLNLIANEQTFRLIDAVLERGVNLKEVFCDTVGDPAKWRDRLAKRYPAISFTVCPKADSLYPIVSAASIVAKVTRDRQLRAAQPEGRGSGAEGGGGGSATAYGSGYPGDPATAAWLQGALTPVFGFPSLVRFSWQTAAKLLEQSAARVAWECEEAGDSSQRTLAFASRKRRLEGPSTGAGRHSFFQARRLQRLAEF